jgi:hypothetical protein
MADLIASLKSSTIAALENYATVNANQAENDFNNAMRSILYEFYTKFGVGYNDALQKYISLTGLTRLEITRNAENPNNAPVEIRSKVQCIAADYKAINDNYYAAGGELDDKYRSLLKID